MKKFILFFILTMCISLSAQNPDGKNASLHVTPSWLWGKANFQHSTSVWYPPTQASDAQTVLSENYGIVNYPFAFGIHTMIKIPAASFLTVSLSYSYNQKFEDDNQSNQQSKYFSQYWALNGKVHKIDFTVSIYNLFSLYQE